MLSLFAINPESVLAMAKALGYIIGLLLVVFLLAVATPKLAKLVDKHLLKKKPDPERVEIDEKSDEIKGIYDSQTDDNTNNKNKDIRNEDIDNG